MMVHYAMCSLGAPTWPQPQPSVTPDLPTLLHSTELSDSWCTSTANTETRLTRLRSWHTILEAALSLPPSPCGLRVSHCCYHRIIALSLERRWTRPNQPRSTRAVVITGGIPATVRMVAQGMLPDLDLCDSDHCQIKHAAHDVQFFDDDPPDYDAGDDDIVKHDIDSGASHDIDAANQPVDHGRVSSRLPVRSDTKHRRTHALSATFTREAPAAAPDSPILSVGIDDIIIDLRSSLGTHLVQRLWRQTALRPNLPRGPEARVRLRHSRARDYPGPILTRTEAMRMRRPNADAWRAANNPSYKTTPTTAHHR